jgi:hypothetical protein
MRAEAGAFSIVVALSFAHFLNDMYRRGWS